LSFISASQCRSRMAPPGRRLRRAQPLRVAGYREVYVAEPPTIGARGGVAAIVCEYLRLSGDGPELASVPPSGTLLGVIRSFVDKRTLALFAGHAVKGLPNQIQRRARG